MQQKKLNILVTGVGAIIGYGIIKSLRKTSFQINIVGMDIYPDAVGQKWCDTFVQAKYAADPKYLSFIRKIMDRYSIDLVFFGTEQEVYKVSASRNELGVYFSKMVVNKKELLELSKDKWTTYLFLLQHHLGQYAIPSTIEGDYRSISSKYGKEFLLKPRSSYASKGIVKVSDSESFDFYKRRMGTNFMAQPLVGDSEHEYTVGVFGLGDGTSYGNIMLKRKLSQEGATAKAHVIHDENLEYVVNLLVNKFRPIGPTNLQFRYHDGEFLLLEVNPRISSSTSIRAALGYNEAELCVNYFLNGYLNAVNVKDGMAWRFIDEVITLL